MVTYFRKLCDDTWTPK